MPRLRIVLSLSVAWVLLFAFHGVVAQESAAVKSKLDVKQLYGTWNYMSGKKAGMKSEKEMLQGDVEINEKNFTLPGGPDQSFVMTYTIDASKSPAEIDLEIQSGPVSEGTAIGIIKLEKGRVVLCYDPTGQERPAKFESTEENGCHLFVLKKAGGLDPSKLPGNWSFISGRRAGEEIGAERMATGIEITDKKIRIPAGPDQAYVMDYELDLEASPVAIDMEMTDGPATGATALGIIRMEDGKLTLCYDPTGQQRPTDFASSQENGCFLFELKQDK